MIERQFVREVIRNFEIENFLRRELEKANCERIDIQRTPLGHRIVVYVERPGLVIGRGGKTIKMLTEILKDKFNLENPQIEVRQVEVSELSPNIMARRIANALERGFHFRRVAYNALRRIMDAGALGAEIIVSGKLIGERARTEKFKAGFLKYAGEPAEKYVLEGFATALPKQGIIGVRVRIIPPNEQIHKELLLELRGGGVGDIESAGYKGDEQGGEEKKAEGVEAGAAEDEK